VKGLTDKEREAHEEFLRRQWTWNTNPFLVVFKIITFIFVIVPGAIIAFILSIFNRNKGEQDILEEARAKTIEDLEKINAKIPLFDKNAPIRETKPREDNVPDEYHEFLAHLMLGISYYKGEKCNMKKAEKELLNAIRFFNVQQDKKKSVKSVLQSFKIKHTFLALPSHFLLGRFYEDYGQHNKAEEYYKKVIDIENAYKHVNANPQYNKYYFYEMAIKLGNSSQSKGAV